MTGLTNTPEGRAAAQVSRKAARQRLADGAATSVRLLLADQTPGTTLPGWARLMAARAGKGNVRALIGLKCADCSCWQRDEIRHCSVPSCPLYPVRPYQAQKKPAK